MIPKFYIYRGRRIKSKDKNLVFRFFFVTFFILFVAITLLLNCNQLLHFKFSDINIKNGIHFSVYNIFTFILGFICVILFFVYYYYYNHNNLMKKIHRQKLSRMILENGWYEKSSQSSSGFFKDIPSNKEKITWFPRVYYRMKDGYVYIYSEISMGKYQNQYLELEEKLESGLYCELTDKVLHDSFVEYTLLYDMIANRISIGDVKVEKGGLVLMKNILWEYDSLPHALICGGTGGGKTYFILTIIEALLRTNAILYILDPKNADLADLGTVMDNVYYKKDDMISCINAFYDGMVARSEEMKKMPNYKTGENYAYLGLPPHFLIFDEYVAFMEMLGNRENTEVLSMLKKIVMLGRQAGFFLILACQRPDAKYLGDGIRDQFNFRVALGRMSDLGYGMMFGSDVKKKFFQKKIKGRGYCDIGTSIISEFYTPLVPREHDFLQTIADLSKFARAGEPLREAKSGETCNEQMSGEATHL